MNSKKSKSKNRPKPSKIPQNVQDTAKVEDLGHIEEAEKCESTNTEEIKVPGQNVETVTVVEEQLASDVPKKPKRSKGKKKQDTWIEPTTCDENLNKNIVKEDQKEDVVEKEMQEADIVPVARKKKNKSKKNIDHQKHEIQPEEVKEKVELQALESNNKTIKEESIKTNLEKNPQKEIEQTETLKNEDVLQKDAIVPKKKKKKKHRHDSEKSDINDPCTLAFQKLLEPSDDVNVSNENEEVSIDNIIITEDAIAPIPVLTTESEDLKENVKDGGSKSKKKNKKGKKHPLETETNKTDYNEDITNVTKDENIITENIELETANVELSPKPKAKIIKPVQKKRKEKSESQEVNIPVPVDVDYENNTDESVRDILDKPETVIDCEVEEKQRNESVLETEPTTIICSKSDLKAIDNTILPAISDEIDNSDVFSNPVKELSSLDTLNKNEQVNIVSENTSEIIADKESKPEKDKIVIDTEKESDDLGFVKVKSGKNKKKRLQNVDSVPEIIESITATTAKNVEKNESEKEIKHNKDQRETFYDVSQLDFEENSFKPEEFEALSIATPDLIQYPRSTSQQHLDNNNNNTVIEEITTPDEVKLGIPIYTAPPIIQGSGESPDAKTIDDPITIKVTEVDSTPSNSNSEKNDIKSRIFEVNKDMEELRRSIERSLAELTGTEKCDSEVDKEFEELFQEQIKESHSSKSPEDKLESFQPEKTILSNQSDDGETKVEKESDDKIKPKVENINIMDKGDEIEPDKVDLTSQHISIEDNSQKPDEKSDIKSAIPICPARNKGKSKSKKKGKKEPLGTSTSGTSSTTQQTDTTNKESSKTSKSNSEKSEQKQQSSKEKGKQQSTKPSEDCEMNSKELELDISFDPIENFEDALTSSVDDVNKTFEIIVNEATESLRQNNPQINVIAPIEDTEEKNKEKKQKKNPASQPKNLLGKPNIPALSNKNDFKKEKNKPPNSIQAKVKIKDSVEIEKVTNKESRESQTTKKIIKETNGPDSYSYLSNTNEDFVYKYSFRKVFLQSSCHVCKKELTQRFPCKFCSLVFYCSQKHQDEDWAKHQSLCFAVSTIAHLKEQKHIYADAQNITGHDYRVLRMQMILSCEKILKRKLVPWEQEALLYPRLCADTSCRQWKQRMLKDCEGCGQISYCIEHPDHLPLSHQRWCKSYALYQKLVNHQQTKGKLEPKLPTKVLEHYKIPDKMNEVLGTMYEEKIDMDDTQYAALTQLASAPLTAAYGYQLFNSKMNSTCANGVLKKSTFTIQAVGTDLQFEADSLNKWEIFFLHLRPDVQDLRVVLIGPELNPSKLPLDLLGKIKLCENCRVNKRRVIFHFHDKETYCDYYSSDDFITPDIVCAFNPNIHRSCMYNVKDTWPATINSVLKQKIPFLISSYSIEELERDMLRVKETSRYNFNVISEPKHNPFCSMRPDRNFITDHEIPLLFKNYCYTILCGAF